MAGSSNISRRRMSARSDGGPEYTAKREELVRIAVRLFKERGYPATRLADIATEAGLDRASIYYYVGGKEELFRESIEGMLSANLSGAEAIASDSKLDATEKLTRIVTLLMVSYEEQYPHMYVYIQEQMHQVAHEETAWAQMIMKKTRSFEAIVRRIFLDGIECGEFRNDVPVALASNALFGMFNWTHRWFTPEGALSAREIAEFFSKIFFEGMRKNTPTGKPVRKRAAPST